MSFLTDGFCLKNLVIAPKIKLCPIQGDVAPPAPTICTPMVEGLAIQKNICCGDKLWH